MARTLRGRIVFASLCDSCSTRRKVAIVPQLALATKPLPTQDGHHQAAQRRSVHAASRFDAAAAKFKPERHLGMPGSFRRSELSQIDKVEWRTARPSGLC